MILKKHLPVIIALGLPLLFILGVIAYVSIPALLISPQYDFLYSNYRNIYQIDKEGNLVKNEAEVRRLTDGFYNRFESDITRLYRYDINANKSTVVTLEEARALNLDNSPISPDGFQIGYFRGNHSIFSEMFGGGRTFDGFVITGKGVSRQLNIERTGGFLVGPGSTDKFLGWIIE